MGGLNSEGPLECKGQENPFNRLFDDTMPTIPRDSPTATHGYIGQGEDPSMN